MSLGPSLCSGSDRSAVVTLYQIFGKKLISDCVTESVSRTYEVSFFCYSFYCVTLQNKSFNYKSVLPCLIELFFHFLSQSHKCIFPGKIRIIDNKWNKCLIVLVENNRIYDGKACTYSLIRANKRNCFNIRMLTDESDSYKTFKILLTIHQCFLK